MAARKNPKYLYTTDENGKKIRTPNPDYQPKSPQQPTDLPISLSSSGQSGQSGNTDSSVSENTPGVVKGAEKEYKQFLEEGLVLLTWLIGMLFGLAVLGDVGAGESIFTMTDEEVDALAPPLASYLAKQKIPARVRKLIVSSNDALAIVAASLVYVQRVGKGITQYVAEHPKPNQRTQSQQGDARAEQPGSNGHADIPDVASLAGIPDIDPELAALAGAYIR